MCIFPRLQRIRLRCCHTDRRQYPSKHLHIGDILVVFTPVRTNPFFSVLPFCSSIKGFAALRTNCDLFEILDFCVQSDFLIPASGLSLIGFLILFQTDNGGIPLCTDIFFVFYDTENFVFIPQAAFQIKLHSFFRQFVRYLLQKFSLYVFPKHSAHDLRFAVYHNELTAFHSVSVADHPVRHIFILPFHS